MVRSGTFANAWSATLSGAGVRRGSVYGKTDDDVYYIAMELIEGETLRAHSPMLVLMPRVTAVSIASMACGEWRMTRYARRRAAGINAVRWTT